MQNIQNRCNFNLSFHILTGFPWHTYHEISPLWKFVMNVISLNWWKKIYNKEFQM
jgi:hypothetical protein